MDSPARSTLDNPRTTSDTSRLPTRVRKNWVGLTYRFLASVSELARVVIAELGRMAIHEYGISLNPQQSTRPCDANPLWYGRLVAWPEGFQYRQFELTRFSLEHRVRKSQNEAVYRLGVSK